METLGAFLLRGGVLAKDVLAAALDRQVVYGGWLDTALLELGLTDEPTMAEHLARWTNYPVCQADWLESVDPLAASPLVPAALAVSHVVAPFAESPEGIWLAVTAPVDAESLGQLAAQLGRPVLPHVATELRVRLALQRLYAARTDPRFEELTAFLQGRSAPPRAVTPHMPMVTAAAVRSAPPPSAQTSTATAQATGAVVLMTQQVFAADVIQPATEPAPPAPPPPAPAPAALEKMDFAEALAHLAGARDRDAVVDITVRYAVQTFQFAAFLGVLKGTAVLWQARVRPGDATDVDVLTGTRFPLEGPSPLRTVVETRAPLLGKPSQTTGGKDFTVRLLRSTSKAMLLQPILVSGRVVGVLYADDGTQAIKTRQASEFLAFLSRVGPAFENLIRDRRARALPAAVPAEPPAPPPPPPTTLSLSVVEAAVAAVQAAPPPPPPPLWEADVPPAPTALHAPADPPVAPPADALSDAAPAPADQPTAPSTHVFSPEPPVEEAPPPLEAVPAADAQADAPPALDLPADPPAPAERASGPPPVPLDAANDEDEEEPRPGEESVALAEPEEPAASRWDGVPEELEPLVANTQIMFRPPVRAPSVPPPLPPQDEVELEVDTSGDTTGPELSKLSPEAAALAAVALARAQAGDDDDDDDDEPDGREARLTEDSTWTDAMAEALHGEGSGAGSADGSFTERGDEGWGTHLAAAAKVAGTLEKPVYQPLPEDDDEDPEQPAAGEESVVFSEVQEGAAASTQAFALALEETIATGKQGGEAADDGYKAFAPDRKLPDPDGPDTDDDDDDAADNAGWESVVMEAADRVDAERAEAGRKAALETPTTPPPAHAGSQPPPLPSARPPPLPVSGPPALPADAAAESEQFVRDEMPPLIDPPRVWVDALGSGSPDRVASARVKLQELGESAVPALIAAFPGRVAFDPFAPDVQVPDPAQLSPLMDVLARMGHVGLQVAIQHLESRYPAHRYFATLLMARVYHPASIPYLLRRLHDDEPRIRKLAGDALASYVAEPSFEQVLRHLRMRINSVTPEGRRRAIHFLGRFRDVGSVPSLIGVLRAKEAELVSEAGQALHVITLQSLGVSERRWVAWWDKNKSRSRIEWLIDALRDGDVEVRSRASAELAQLTRDTFGFRADGARRDRELAIKKWERWWADERRRLSGAPT
jgi:hypothetical protein